MTEHAGGELARAMLAATLVMLAVLAAAVVAGIAIHARAERERRAGRE